MGMGKKCRVTEFSIKFYCTFKPHLPGRDFMQFSKHDGQNPQDQAPEWRGYTIYVKFQLQELLKRNPVFTLDLLLIKQGGECMKPIMHAFNETCC
jgi:hypothetical protein